LVRGFVTDVFAGPVISVTIIGCCPFFRVGWLRYEHDATADVSDMNTIICFRCTI
jgi:hypothetical protein